MRAVLITLIVVFAVLALVGMLTGQPFILALAVGGVAISLIFGGIAGGDS